MRWEEQLLGFFEDLEQQAEGLALAERDAEVAERGRAEYAQVALSSRLHASPGRRLTLGVPGCGPLTGTLSRVGRDWCLLDTGGCEWVVRLAAVTHLRGLADRGVPESAQPLGGRLGVGSAFRGLAESRTTVAVHAVDGTTYRGLLRRVGADFVELLPVPEEAAASPDGVIVLPFTAIGAVASR